MSEKPERAAAYILERRRGRIPIGDLPADCAPADETEAYAIQARLHQATAPLGGYKIGCTTPVMQDYIGIRQPCAGGINEAEIHRSGAILQIGQYLRPGVECEIAAELGRPLPPSDTAYDRAAVGSAVSALHTAIEVVDDRYEDWRSMSAPALIADDFFNAGAVLGLPIKQWDPAELDGLTGWMRINGHEVGTGRGSDILGHPFEALAWLANQRSATGQGLAAGNLVLLGSIVQTHWIHAGDQIEVGIDQLGTASVQFV